MCEPVTLTVIGTELAAGSIAAAGSTALFGTAAAAATLETAAVAGSAGLLGTGGAFLGGTALTTATAATGAANLYGQQQAANEQSRYNQNQAKNLRLSSIQNANQIGFERLQANEAAGQKLNANEQSLRESQAAVVARAGPTGISLDSLLADMGRKGGAYNASVNANLDRTNMSLDNQLENVNTATTSGFNQLKTPAPVDYLGTALKIGNAYNKTATV